MMFSDLIFYHIYPLGMCGAAKRNDFAQPAGTGLRELTGRTHLERLARLGVNAVYIGPLFESGSHGYDTVDYFFVDRRLGTNACLAELVRVYHQHNIAVVLDAVFNHTGRDFFAFKDIQQHKAASKYTDWYVGLDFSRNNDYHDGFSYEGWAGHTSLVKLNLDTPAVRAYLFEVLRFWIHEFNIDGLRLDAANVMSVDFLRALSAQCKAQKAEFFLTGETVAGDYRALAHEGCLDSVTNYELYKGLWSHLNDKNAYEITWTLKRQFASDGLYPRLPLYNFLDNHDVNRVRTVLHQPAHLFLVYGILFCIPGCPSIYYGSEYGIHGARGEYDDFALRPAWQENWREDAYAKDLFAALCRFADIRRASSALRRGSYDELFVRHEQFAFIRRCKEETIIVVTNAAMSAQTIFLAREKLPESPCWRDLLSEEVFQTGETGLTLPLYPSWLRILRAEV